MSSVVVEDTRSVSALPALRAAIDERGLRYSWVAERIGVSRPMFSMVLSGERRLAGDRARLLAELIEADFFSLFDTSNAGTVPSSATTGVRCG